MLLFVSKDILRCIKYQLGKVTSRSDSTSSGDPRCVDPLSKSAHASNGESLFWIQLTRIILVN